MSTSSTSSHQDHSKKSNTWFSIPVRYISDANSNKFTALVKFLTRGKRESNSWLSVHWCQEAHQTLKLAWKLGPERSASFQSVFLKSFASYGSSFIPKALNKRIRTFERNIWQMPFLLLYIEFGRHGCLRIIWREFMRNAVLNINSKVVYLRQPVKTLSGLSIKTGLYAGFPPQKAEISG
jgi:hypothetical protein